MLFEIREDRRPIRAREVHLRDEDKGRDMIPFEQVPERLRMRLHALRSAHDEDGVIEDPEDPFGLGGEIDVARRVEQGDGEIARLEYGLLREDGDPALALQLVRIEVGVAPVDAPGLFDFPGGIKKGFRERGLSDVHVREDPEDDLFHAFLRSFRLCGGMDD